MTTTEATTEKTRGQVILDWIKERHAEGRTVYAATALRIYKIAPKHAELVRVKGEHCQVLQGKVGWVSINYTKITAQ